MPTKVASTRAARVDELRRAAIPVFAAQGFRGTSMDDVARAAGVSRPALYQYFDNRADLFRAAFDAVLGDATDAALEALARPGTVSERLDGYLQRASGDLYEALVATPFGAELMDARHEFAADVAAASLARCRAGLRRFVSSIDSDVDAATRRAVVDLLMLSPVGLKSDLPTSPAYRRRLSALAAAAAGMLERDGGRR